MRFISVAGIAEEYWGASEGYGHSEDVEQSRWYSGGACLSDAGQLLSDRTTSFITFSYSGSPIKRSNSFARSYQAVHWTRLIPDGGHHSKVAT